MICQRCRKEIKDGYYNYLTITVLPVNESINYRRSGICTDLCNDCLVELKQFLGNYYL